MYGLVALSLCGPRIIHNLIIDATNLLAPKQTIVALPLQVISNRLLKNGVRLFVRPSNWLNLSQAGRRKRSSDTFLQQPATSEIGCRGVNTSLGAGFSPQAPRCSA